MATSSADLAASPLRRPLCLVTDIDGTLHGHDEPMRELLGLMESAQRASLPECAMVYNTGRSLPSFLRLHKAEAVPLPDVFIGGTGTEMYTFERSSNGEIEAIEVAAYASYIAKGGWDKAAVTRAVEATVSAAPHGVVATDPDNGRNKLKHALTVTAAALEDFITVLRARLVAENVPEGAVSQAVVCSHFQDPTLAYVDIVPSLANKGAATTWLLRNGDVHFGWNGFSATDVLVCGDSGNDQAMFDLLHDDHAAEDAAVAAGTRLPGAKGVLVSNAKPEMLRYAESALAQRAASLHLAESEAASGIMEALTHFGWIGS